MNQLLSSAYFDPQSDNMAGLLYCEQYTEKLPLYYIYIEK